MEKNSRNCDKACGFAIALASGWVMGWLWATKPSLLGDIKWLEVLTAFGTVGAAIAAVWIALSNRSHELTQRWSDDLARWRHKGGVARLLAIEAVKCLEEAHLKLASHKAQHGVVNVELRRMEHTAALLHQFISGDCPIEFAVHMIALHRQLTHALEHIQPLHGMLAVPAMELRQFAYRAERAKNTLKRLRSSTRRPS